MKLQDSKESSLILQSKLGLHRLLKIIFSSDGSIYLTFPGFNSSEGILSQVVLKHGEKYPHNIDLAQAGKVTRHLIKYSHHKSGQAHFSMDSKIKTMIKKQSVPLENYEGHLFTVEIGNCSSYAPSRKKIKSDIIIQADPSPRNLKFIGWMYPVSALSLEGYDENIHTITGVKFQDGVTKTGVIFSCRKLNTILFLEIKESTLEHVHKGQSLMFLGGFDPLSISLNHSVDTSFLILSYPCSNYEELRAKIGTVDLESNPHG